LATKSVRQYLTFRHVVSSEGADDEAGVAGVRLGAVAGKSGAGLDAAATTATAVSALRPAAVLRRR
jgi:hypothetical protein